MDTTVALLRTHAGRDKIMRTTGFACMLISGSTAGKTAQNLGTIAKQISAARVITRLFDDLPMLSTTLSYGCGSQEKDPVKRFLTILANLSSQVFFPVEHLAWLAQHNIISADSNRLVKAGIGLWAISLTSNIIKGIKHLSLLRMKQRHLIKQRKLESPEKSGSADNTFKQSIREVQEEINDQLIDILKNGSDFVNAISWLPLKGFLWSERLTTAQNGFFGTVASGLGIYQLVKQMHPKRD